MAMAMIPATNSTSKRLGPYVFAFAAGAMALSTLAQTRRTQDQLDDAKARDEIANKLLNRFARRYGTARAG